MLGKILKKFKKGGDEPKEGEAPEIKLAPTDYYPVLFGNFDFNKKIVIEEKKKFGRINPLKKIGSRKKTDSQQKTAAEERDAFLNTPSDPSQAPSDPNQAPPGPSKAQYEVASQIITQIKRHFKVDDFRNQWKKLKVKPGVEGHSQVVVYGNIQVNEDKDFPFFVFNNDIGISCKIDKTPNFTEGRIAVLGTAHTTFEEHPRLYLDVEILYLHKDDFV